ncbi:MAG: PAS domain S-box protein, partial [Candidatus Hydrothermarchaeales archaeon]
MIKGTTERKKVENKLKESESWFRHAVDDAPFPMMIHAEDGEVLKINRVWTELTGYAPEDIPTIADWTEKAYGQRMDVVKEDIDDAFKLDTRKDWGEYVITTSSGEKITWDFSSAPLGVLTDGRRLTLSMAKDITERKKVEKYLQQYEYIVSSSTDMLALLDNRFVYIAANTAYVEAFNLTLDKIIGHTVSEVFGEEFFDKVIKPNAERCLAGGKVNYQEWFDFPAYEVERYMEINYYPYFDNENNITGFVVNARDITERKKAEKALRERESKYRSLFENMLDGFAYCKIVLDENNQPIDFVYLDVNDAFETLTGLKREDVVGKKVTEAIPGIKEANPELFDIYGKVALTGKEAKFDIYVEPLEIWLSISVYSPKKEYFVAVFENITERKRAEEALQKRTYDLGERVKELNCLYGISDLVEKPGISLDEIFQGTAELIPPSWQYPEVTCARIVFEDKEYKTKNFKKTKWKHSSNIIVHGNKVGFVEVYYLEKKPASDEDPFLKEERSLINAIAERLGKITERKKAEEEIKADLKEKEVLLQEIHHRVKNNLQVVSSLLELQSGYIKDKRDLRLLKESQNRIKSMALVHEKLYQSKDLANIDFSDYIEDLTNNLFMVYEANASKIALKIDVKDVSLGINAAIPCGLIINELISNSLKHAFPEGRGGEIEIVLH